MFSASWRYFFYWYFVNLRFFARNVPYVFVAAIVNCGMARVANLLAYLLPLKVVIFAADVTVPQFFWFVRPEEKTFWVGVLVAATLLVHLLAMVLDASVEYLSERGSARLLQIENKIIFTSELQNTASKHFQQHVKIFANAIFFLCSLIVLAFFSQAIVITICILLLLMYAHVDSLLDRNSLHKTRARKLLDEKLSSFIQFWFSVIFFVSFALVLLHFFSISDGNILLPILSIMVLRQALATLSLAILDAVHLLKELENVIGIFRHSEQLPKPVKNFYFFEDFKPASRLSIASHALKEFGSSEGGQKCDSYWIDSEDVRVKTILVQSSTLPVTQKALLRFFSKKACGLQDNEMSLFRYVTREAVGAPALLGSFQYDSFFCDLLQFGESVNAQPSSWKSNKKQVLQSLWGFCPPQALIDAFASTHPLLHQRLSLPLVQLLEVAADTAKKRTLVDRFFAALPGLQIRLKHLPLFLYNPNLRPSSATHMLDGKIVITHWWNWSIEPLGGGRLYHQELPELIKMLPALRQNRSDIPEEFGERDLRLAHGCQILENDLRVHKINAALNTSERILDMIEMT